MADLDVITPEGVRRVHLERDRLSIGRLSYNDIALPSTQISRQHAELRCIDGQWWIADLQSTNGLHLRGKRIQQHQLVNGDRIALSPDISIRFLEEVEVAAPPPMTRYVPQPPLPPQPMPEPAPRPPLGRSPFADDEVPYVPPGMAVLPPRHPAKPPEIPDPYEAPPTQRRTMPASGTLASGFASASGDRYAATSQPDMESVLRDPYIRSGSGLRYPAGGVSSTQLHVCQTCSQLTAPDAVYCQNCHHSIAYECPKCRLNLLPIHDRCPRCQTPNPASVRRSRRNSDS